MPGWVTIFGNHLGAEPRTQAYSAWARPLWVVPTEGGLGRLKWVHGKSWGVNRHIAWYTSPYPWSCSVCWCLAEGISCGDQRWLTGSSRALAACLRRCVIQMHVYFTYLHNLQNWVVWPCHQTKHYNAMYMVALSASTPLGGVTGQESNVSKHITQIIKFCLNSWLLWWITVSR